MSSTDGDTGAETARLRAALAETAAREERFRRTFEQANVGIAHVGVDGRFLEVNDGLCTLLGRSRDEVLALTFQDLTHPADLDADLGLLGQLLAGTIPSYSMEKRYLRPDGSIVWGGLSVSLVRGADGGPMNFISIVADIHDRKEAEERVELVLGETSHRIKNLFAVIGAIVTTSARGAKSVQGLQQVITQRLMGISASHDLLMGKYESGATLDKLIIRQLEIFTDCSTERIALAGPAVSLNTAAVHAFGMVIHELATNACKYGSLSGDAGIVRVGWTVDEAAGTLAFSWREEGGPNVAEPQHSGFGAKTLERMLGGALRGTARLSLPPEGARFEAVLPLAAILAA